MLTLKKKTLCEIYVSRQTVNANWRLLLAVQETALAHKTLLAVTAKMINRSSLLAQRRATFQQLRAILVADLIHSAGEALHPIVCRTK